MTPATLAFLRELCNRTTLSGSSPSLEIDAYHLVNAIKELDLALAQVPRNVEEAIGAGDAG